MFGPVFWKVISLAISISIFSDSVKHKRYISGVLWAAASFFLPFVAFIYWTFGRNAQIHTTPSFREPIHSGKKLCSKCGTENASNLTLCSNCGNKLQLK